MSDRRLDELRQAIQIDPGKRGLDRDPDDNLFTRTLADFAAACQSLSQATGVWIVTGFYIPSANPPAYETDGPPGALCLQQVLAAHGIPTRVFAESPVLQALDATRPPDAGHRQVVTEPSHVIWIERSGPNAEGRHLTMRGLDISQYLNPELTALRQQKAVHISIGDGGNEMGMGNIPTEVIARNIPNGEKVHCVVRADHLIVAGVSNWGGYALAAGVDILRGRKPHGELYNPQFEQNRIQKMVDAGPLVDGVSGRATATVDGLDWETYCQPLLRIREVLDS